MKDIEKGCKRSKRSINQIDTIVRFYTAASDDYHEIESSSIEQSSKQTLVLNSQILRHLGYDIPIPNALNIQRVIPTNYTAYLIEKTIDLVPIDAVKAANVFGTIDECIDQIEKFVQAGARHIVIHNAGSDETLRSYGKIIKYFKEN